LTRQTRYVTIVIGRVLVFVARAGSKRRNPAGVTGSSPTTRRSVGFGSVRGEGKAVRKHPNYRGFDFRSLGSDKDGIACEALP